MTAVEISMTLAVVIGPIAAVLITRDPGEASCSARTTDGHLSYFDANTNGKCEVVP